MRIFRNIFLNKSVVELPFSRIKNNKENSGGFFLLVDSYLYDSSVFFTIILSGENGKENDASMAHHYSQILCYEKCQSYRPVISYYTFDEEAIQTLFCQTITKKITKIKSNETYKIDENLKPNIRSFEYR